MSLFERHIPNWDELKQTGHVINRNGSSVEFVRSALVRKLIENAYRCGERFRVPEEFITTALISQSHYEMFYNSYLRVLDPPQRRGGGLEFLMYTPQRDLGKTAQLILQDEREDDD